MRATARKEERMSDSMVGIYIDAGRSREMKPLQYALRGKEFFD